MGQENGKWYLEYVADTPDGKRGGMMVSLNGAKTAEEAMPAAISEWEFIKKREGAKNPSSGHLVHIIPLVA